MAKYLGFDKYCGKREARPTLQEAREQENNAPLREDVEFASFIDVSRFRELAMSDEVTEGRKIFHARKLSEAYEDAFPGEGELPDLDILIHSIEEAAAAGMTSPGLAKHSVDAAKATQATSGKLKPHDAYLAHGNAMQLHRNAAHMMRKSGDEMAAGHHDAWAKHHEVHASVLHPETGEQTRAKLHADHAARTAAQKQKQDSSTQAGTPDAHKEKAAVAKAKSPHNAPTTKGAAAQADHDRMPPTMPVTKAAPTKNHGSAEKDHSPAAHAKTQASAVHSKQTPNVKKPESPKAGPAKAKKGSDTQMSMVAKAAPKKSAAAAALKKRVVPGTPAAAHMADALKHFQAGDHKKSEESFQKAIKHASAAKTA